MEDYLIGVLGGLLGFIGFFIGQRLSGKNETLAKQSRWYEEELQNMRTEVKRYRARASYFQKGAVPSELADAGSTSQLIEGIFQALPPNLRQLAAPFKATAIEYAEKNPEVVEQIKKGVLQKLGQGEGEAATQQIDSL